MGFVGELSAALALVALVYWWYISVTKTKTNLRWIPSKPGWPILGNVFDFTGGSTEHLNTLLKYVEYSKEKKAIHMQFVNKSIIIITDYKLLEFLLSSNSLKILDKSHDYTYLLPWLGTGLLTSGGKKWKSRRRILTPTFHFQILEQFVDVFESNGSIFIDELKKELGNNSFDIYPYVTNCTLDIICESAMGVSVNAQTQKHSEYVRSVKEMCRIIVERAFSPIEMFDTLYYFTKNYKIQKECIKILHMQTNKVIMERRKELQNSNENVDQVGDDVGVKKRKAFLDMLLEATIDGKPLSTEDIREEVDTFMFEGHDTTASAISFAIYLLSKHSKEQTEVYKELKEIFSDDENRATTYRDLQEMKYLENVIKETLRIYPSVPMFARSVSDDIEYKEGKIIPKGTQIGVFVYGVGRDKDYFKEPEKFMPSRFNDMDGKSPFSYIPFSAGPRNCIGQKFAMLEMKSALSKLIRNYEILPSIPEHNVILASETVLKSVNGIRVKIQKRK